MNGLMSQGLIEFQTAWAKTVHFILTPESGIDPLLPFVKPRLLGNGDVQDASIICIYV